jgi:hypothetical protein
MQQVLGNRLWAAGSGILSYAACAESHMGHKPSRRPRQANSRHTNIPEPYLNLPAASVLRYADADQPALTGLLHRYGIEVLQVEAGAAIPGSFWGDEEAGLMGNRLLLRPDTPVHSALHEACHFICMDPTRRAQLDTNAGGDYDEENAVCYLQILLAGCLPGFGAARMMSDMDAWGYSFRLGSAQAWFEQDAADARQTLLHWQLIDQALQPTFRLREDPA